MEKFGGVNDCKVFADKKGSTLGYGYVEFARPTSVADIKSESEKGFLLLDKSGLPLDFEDYKDREVNTGVVERRQAKFRNELAQEPHFVMSWNQQENESAQKFHDAYKEYKEKRKSLKEEFEEQMKELRHEFDAFAAKRPTHDINNGPPPRRRGPP